MNDSGCAGVDEPRLPASQSEPAPRDFVFEAPVSQDGHAVAKLIAACAPLDPNSLYCNLLQCTHFAATSIKAERNGALDGWISGYRLPGEPSTLFIWQVAVHERARGRGLGVAMLEALVSRPGLADATRLETTITPSNDASRRMFAKFARNRGATLESRPWFDRYEHFGGSHESEELISIGPL